MKTTLKLKEVLFRTSLLGSIFNSCISLSYGMEADLGTETKGHTNRIKTQGLEERLRQQFAQEESEAKSEEKRRIERAFQEAITNKEVAEKNSEVLRQDLTELQDKYLVQEEIVRKAEEKAQTRAAKLDYISTLLEQKKEELVRLHQAQELLPQQGSFDLPEGYYSIINNGKFLASTSGKATEILGHADHENSRNLWYISPAEERGCYTITRHKNGEEYLSYTTKDAHTEAEVYSNASCERDGTWRHYVLWHIDPTENGFMLRNYHFPGTGYLSYSYLDPEKKQPYAQVLTGAVAEDLRHVPKFTWQLSRVVRDEEKEPLPKGCSHLSNLVVDKPASEEHLDTSGEWQQRLEKLLGQDLWEKHTSHTLTELNLDNKNIGDKGAIELAKSNLSALKSLSLRGNNVGNEGAIAIGFATFSSLTKLDLRGNVIGDEGAKALSSGSLNNLISLNLDQNNIGPEGVKPIAAGNFSNLKALYLVDNKIGDEGTIAIANGNLVNLTTLSLEHNGIGDKGAKAVSSGNLINLKWLNMYNNNIGPEGAKALSVGNLTNLQNLNLVHNNIGDKGRAAFAKKKDDLEVHF